MVIKRTDYSSITMTVSLQSLSKSNNIFRKLIYSSRRALHLHKIYQEQEKCKILIIIIIVIFLCIVNNKFFNHNISDKNETNIMKYHRKVGKSSLFQIIQIL